jgi:hypothetical protein
VGSAAAEAAAVRHAAPAVGLLLRGRIVLNSELFFEPPLGFGQALGARPRDWPRLHGAALLRRCRASRSQPSPPCRVVSISGSSWP